MPGPLVYHAQQLMLRQYQGAPWHLMRPSLAVKLVLTLSSRSSCEINSYQQIGPVLWLRGVLAFAQRLRYQSPRVHSAGGGSLSR